MEYTFFSYLPFYSYISSAAAYLSLHAYVYLIIILIRVIFFFTAAFLSLFLVSSNKKVFRFVERINHFVLFEFFFSFCVLL
jgi:hypothetical protein